MSRVLDDPPLPLLLPPPELELSLPQAAMPTASAATRQPEAAIRLVFKEPLLIRVSYFEAAILAATCWERHQRARRRGGIPRRQPHRAVRPGLAATRRGRGRRPAGTASRCVPRRPAGGTRR